LNKKEKEELIEKIRALYEGRSILSRFDNGFVEAVTQILYIIKCIPEPERTFYPPIIDDMLEEKWSPAFIRKLEWEPTTTSDTADERLYNG